MQTGWIKRAALQDDDARSAGGMAALLALPPRMDWRPVAASAPGAGGKLW